jgi:hypothetical protein
MHLNRLSISKNKSFKKTILKTVPPWSQYKKLTSFWMIPCYKSKEMTLWAFKITKPRENKYHS